MMGLLYRSRMSCNSLRRTGVRYQRGIKRGKEPAILSFIRDELHVGSVELSETDLGGNAVDFSCRFSANYVSPKHNFSVKKENSGVLKPLKWVLLFQYASCVV